MSRNFELLHEAGRVQGMLRQRVEEAVPDSPVFVPGTPTLPIEGMAREEVTKLVQRLFLMPGGPAARQVVFAGTEQGNGCSWICARVADILASQVAGSVCIVDCDMRYPTLHTEFQVSNHYGLAEALLGGEPIRQFAQQLSRPNLWLLSCGSENEHSQQLLTLEKMRKRMAELRAEFDYVLLDVAPLSISNHAITLGNWCDGATLILKANSSTRSATRKLLEQLRAANVSILGAVLNQRTFPIPHSIYSRL
ncbi:MAG: CpsD/CapB family tyrosine-protein kinase [Candidatus Sulfotelmatobacter sp.]